MSKSDNGNRRVNYSEQIATASKLLTEVQWIVLQNEGESLESIGAILGLARVRVKQLRSKALEVFRQAIREDIESFLMRLEELEIAEGAVPTLEKCLITFPELNEVEFNILMAICDKKLTVR